jgi:DNA-binding transcriptional MerR regulator
MATDWTDRYRDWEGTAAELANEASAVAEDIRISDGDAEKGGNAENRAPWRPNERLVRHYVQVGILDRPERAGKEAHFRFRQLIELLATRVLLNDGWPLAKIADYVRLEDDAGLLGLLPKGAPLTPAQEAVRRIQRSAASAKAMASRPAAAPGAPSASAAPPEFSPMRQSVDHLKRRQEAFPGGETPEIETWLHIKLTPWCHVHIEREAARAASPDTIERLGRALAQSLIEFIRRGDRK